uniref:Uncharacterized protein n=1 Tax=Molossus molossus TaxID=27622 RepID=A0A7J8C8J5_MOLMO|nr:hypothetical protein HJG59_009882 [Molossus molossus]
MDRFVQNLAGRRGSQPCSDQYGQLWAGPSVRGPLGSGVMEGASYPASQGASFSPCLFHLLHSCLFVSLSPCLSLLNCLLISFLISVCLHFVLVLCLPPHPLRLRPSHCGAGGDCQRLTWARPSPRLLTRPLLPSPQTPASKL